jgi:nitrous oxide reductase accessory protein NosL
MKRKSGIVCLIALVLLSLAVAVVAGNDIDQFRSCSQCGMDRKAYGYSRMMINYENGTQVGVCSVHCAVTEMNKHAEHAVKSLQVADRDTRTLIDVKKAFWVIGGSKRGVMTQIPTWAFATKEGAEAFVASSGGKTGSWESVLLAAREGNAPTKQPR